MGAADSPAGGAGPATRGRLADLVVAGYCQLAEARERNGAAISSVLADAEREASRILATAHTEVVSMPASLAADHEGRRDEGEAYAYLVSSLSLRLASEEARLEAGLNRARVEAAERVRAAHAEAAALVAAAGTGRLGSGMEAAPAAGPVTGVGPGARTTRVTATPWPRSTREETGRNDIAPGNVPSPPTMATAAPAPWLEVRAATAPRPPAAPAPPASRPALYPPTPISRTSPGPRGRRTGIRRFLYADVVLPLLAVLIVLLILVAWVG